MPEPLCPLCKEPLDDGRAVQTSLDGEVHHDCVLEKNQQVDAGNHGASNASGKAKV